MLQPDLPSTAGNIVSATRLADALSARGVSVTMTDVAASADWRLHEFDLVHAFHAIRAGIPVREAALQSGTPYVVTITGTDLTDGQDELPPDLVTVLADAAGVVVFHAAARKQITERLPQLGERVALIPPGVTFVAATAPFAAPWSSDAFVFLLPAGLRPVKDPLFAVQPLARLRERYPRLILALAGPGRDAAMAADVANLGAELPWVYMLGEVPRSRMCSLYQQAQVVLNTSLHEGLSNAVLEAMACGRPLLARDIPGNRAVIRHGQNGLLFGDAHEFTVLAESLIQDASLRERLGRAAEAEVHQRYRTEAEAAAHLELYRRALG